ncbi:MAG: fused MFS/spermidine synthase [Phycisphaerales bacterium]|nr:MAG: fused MFS/spermidine synthase [Phycisphaerales bacterium]
MSTLKGMVRMLVPSVTVFFASGCLMILELVAARLVARALGSSLYTWTAILGVVFAGVGGGNYIGGRLADRFHVRRVLAVLFGLSSAACVGIVILNNVVGRWGWLWSLDWPVHVFAHVALVFLLPSVLLGMIGPAVAKLALDQGLGPGRTMGTIYAWGAAGGLAGTFLAGFFLFAHYGSIAVVWSIGAAMLAMALFYWISCWALHLWALVFGALATMGMAPADWAQVAGVSAGLREMPDPNAVLYKDETSFGRVQVTRVSQRPDRRAFSQDQPWHSELIIGDVTNLQQFHTKVYAGLTEGLSGPEQALTAMVVGARGYAFPQYLQATWPAAEVEVVEVDPGVTRAALAAFGLPEDTAIRTVNADARNHVDRLLRRMQGGESTQPHDFIYQDAISGHAVPFELVTKEFNDKIAELLTDDGVYLANLVDTYESGKFLGAVIGTLEQTFPYVRVIANRVRPPSLQETFVVVAARRPFYPHSILSRHNKYLPLRVLDVSEMTHLKEQADRLVLTDDYAPVESLLAPVVRQGATERRARRCFRQAEALQRQGHQGPSTTRYREAMALNPSLTIGACNAIAFMSVEAGDLEAGAEALQEAIDYQTDRELEQTAIASIHMNLGLLLRRMGRDDEGRDHLAEAVKWFRIDLDQHPNSVVGWAWLGDTLTILKDAEGATEAFERAVALEPENVSHYEKLVELLKAQQRYDEAIAVLRQQIAMLKERGERDAALELSQYVEILEYERVKRQRRN